MDSVLEFSFVSVVLTDDVWVTNSDSEPVLLLSMECDPVSVLFADGVRVSFETVKKKVRVFFDLVRVRFAVASTDKEPVWLRVTVTVGMLDSDRLSVCVVVAGAVGVPSVSVALGE